MKLTDLEIADLCRELALLIHGGIGVADGIFLLAEEEQGRLCPLLQEMGAGLDGGSSLATVMELSGAFPLCVTGMVQVGERTGRMEAVLSSLGKFYEQRSRSHRPQDYYGQPHFMPEYADGAAMLQLSRARCAARDAELKAVAAFSDREGNPTRVDILRAMNRMSSMLYILMIKMKKDK